MKRLARPRVRLLDIGCGNGTLMIFLQKKLPELNPDATIDIRGFDVVDAKVQASGFRPTRPDISLVRSTDPWPYEDGSIDIAVSNQVLEHVHDHEFFTAQLTRVLADGGVAIHLFPLACCWIEWHVNLPFAHWFTNYDALRGYLRLASSLRLGKYKTMRFLSLGEWCEQHADYLIHETNYRTAGEIKALAKRHRMRCSFRYTSGFYLNKLRQVRGAALRYTYRPAASHIAAAVLARLSCVTAVMEKRNSYPGAHPV